jgi:hypothetical protein
MFKPSAKIKKILGTYGNCAYVHRNGIVICEKRTIKVDGNSSADLEIWHVIPCEIYMRAYDYAASSTVKVNRLVLHNASLIANGLEEIHIALNNNSNAAKQHGFVINSVEFKNNYQSWRDTSIAGLYGGDVTIQPNHTEMYSSDGNSSVREYLEHYYPYGKSIVIHGELPQQENKQSQQLLTVSN